MDSLEAFHDAARHLAHVVQATPRGSRWYLACDTDADGLCAAAVVATSLQRAGYRFQVRASREKDAAAYMALAQVETDGIIVLDKGTSHVTELSEVSTENNVPILVIDHHNILHDELPAGIHLLNPRAVGLDGSRDASSSTGAVAFALAMDGRNADLGPIGLVGAIGDWQHMGGWKGWNKELVEDGLENHHLTKHPQVCFIGMDLADAITRWEDPSIPTLQGDIDATHDFLDRIGIPRGLDNESLTPDQETALLSALTIHGIAHGMEPAQLDRLVRHDLWSAKLNSGLRRLFRTVDACGREGRTGTGLAFLMGDDTARTEAEECFARYRTTISVDLQRLHKTGAAPRAAMQHFEATRAAYTGMVAGLGMTHVVPDGSKPLCVSAPRDDGELQVSTRGSDEQVHRGLNLGEACRAAAASVGREGGGHPVAAGAVIAPGDLEAFLAALDDVLVTQDFQEKP